MGSRSNMNDLIKQGISPKKDIMNVVIYECSMESAKPCTATKMHHISVLVEDLSIYERWRLSSGRSRHGHPMHDHENRIFFRQAADQQADIIANDLNSVTHASFRNFLKAIGYNGKTRTYAARKYPSARATAATASSQAFKKILEDMHDAINVMQNEL